MAKNGPAVSVCMATYNGEKYLFEQLRSILGQLGPHDELVISDDHSTDNTIDIILQLSDPRITLILNNGQKGYSQNFENAIRNATGQMIFISDQDDVWHENKVAVMSRYLQDCDLVISDATYVDEALQVTRGSHFKLSRMTRGFFRHLAKPCYIGACMAFNRRILTKLLPFPQRATYCAYDYWITLVGESCYRVKLVDEELILYRRHGSNASPAGLTSPNSLLRKILIRAYSLGALTSRITTVTLRDAIRSSQ
jgi:glycosyltransferase involved in cell wall biosynthesis